MMVAGTLAAALETGIMPWLIKLCTTFTYFTNIYIYRYKYTQSFAAFALFMPQNMQIVCRFPMVRHKSDSWQTIFLCNEHNRCERRGHFAVSFYKFRWRYEKTGFHKYWLKLYGRHKLPNAEIFINDSMQRTYTHNCFCFCPFLSGLSPSLFLFLFFLSVFSLISFSFQCQHWRSSSTLYRCRRCRHLLIKHIDFIFVAFFVWDDPRRIESRDTKREQQ